MEISSISHKVMNDIFTLNYITRFKKLSKVVVRISRMYIFNLSDTQMYRVQNDTASDYGGFKRKKRPSRGSKLNMANTYSQRLPSRPQSSCAITQIGVPEKRW